MRWICPIWVLLVVAFSLRFMKIFGLASDDIERQCTKQIEETDGIKKIFREYLSVSCNGFPQEKLSENITSLEIIKGSLELISATTLSTLPKNLTTLRLIDCDIQNIEPGAFDQFVKLDALRISRNPLKKLKANTFRFNPKLRELNLELNKLELIEDEALNKLSSLTRLNLKKNQLKNPPKKLPPTLKELILTDNQIEKLENELSMLELKLLDLCGNPLNGTPNENNINMKKIDNLCLTTNDVGQFNENFAIQVPFLENLKLKANKNIEMNVTSLEQLGVLKDFQQLSIVNYNISTLNFLKFLPNIKVLHLQNVLLTKELDLDFNLPPSHNLTTLILDDSKELVTELIPKKILKKIPQLGRVSLQNTNIKKLNPDDFPDNPIYITLKENPLLCGCDMKWLVNVDKQIKLLEKETTNCENPPEVNLFDYLTNLDCSTKKEDFEGSGTITDATTETSDQQNPTPNKKPQKSNRINYDDEEPLPTLVIIIIVIVLLLVVVFIIAIIYYIMMKKRTKRIQLEQKEPTLKELQQSSSEDRLLTKG